jgi:integrase/recombinase XerD
LGLLNLENGLWATANKHHLNVSDYRDTGEQRSLRFREKGGKDREIPVRHDLEGWINDYLAAAGMLEASKASPFFRSADKTKALTAARYTTRIYDRRRRKITRNIVERISI